MPRIAIPGALLIALAGVPNTSALAAPQPDAARLLRDLERLQVVGRVLYVAAHPDDENTRLLAWLVAEPKVRAAYLSLTRGEGGQNLIGAEQAPLLGLIRTNELLAARGIDGAEQLFGSERDFGFSKSSDETLRIWGKAEALGDVVWAIRKFQPDVIITRFSPDDHETHGHHTSSAILALEAFRAAADAKAYPEQLKFVQPWQAKRIVWNRGGFGPQVKEEGLVTMDLGNYDALLGTSAGEVAAKSRSMHKSQGFGAAPQRGPSPDTFKLLAGEPMTTSFLDGVDLTWGRAPGAAKLQALLAQARAQYDFAHPAAIIPTLLAALDALEVLPEKMPFLGLKEEKRAAISEAIAACAGLYVDALAAESSTTPGAKLSVSATALNRSATKIALSAVRIFSAAEKLAEKSWEAPLANNVAAAVEMPIVVPASAPLSNPYWLNEPPSAGRWISHDFATAALPEQPAALRAEYSLSIDGHALTLRRPISYVWTDPVMGERRRALEILPPASLELSETMLAFPDANPRTLRVTVRASKAAVAGTVRPEAPQGFQLEPRSLSFQVAAGTEQTLEFQISPPQKLSAETDSATGTLKLLGTLEGGGTLDRSVRRLDYSHIPIQTLTPRAEVKLVRFSMQRALTKVGYIPGAGDEVPQALKQVGYQVTMLSDALLASEALSNYEAIVVGVRAFNVNEQLNRFHQKLMDYVSNGGTLLVQYNTQNNQSKPLGQLGPWHFDIARDRVTDEEAEVTFLDPKHPLLNSPNLIGKPDFANWIQERGIYFASSWDEQYTPLFSMHDPGEAAKKGSLLVGKSGKGQFIYTGLVFFRELPAGVPGAYRLFANLLSHAR
jgi:LmbE family N-acetylglucosaminyl deacetylase